MGILSELVDLLAPCVSDAIPVAEEEIRQFGRAQNVFLRDDYVRFLTRFGCQPGQRLEIFRQYGGDFGFETMKRVYLEQHFDMSPPLGKAFFGSMFMDPTFCVDDDSGKIYAYDSGLRYGMVHETIDGFIFECLLHEYYKEHFSISLKKDVAIGSINDFKLMNEDKKIPGATRFEAEYEHVDAPEIRVEFYFIDGKLVALYGTSGNICTYSGSILKKLK